MIRNIIFDWSGTLAQQNFVFGNGNTFPQMYDTLGRLVFFNAVAKF